MPDVPTPPSPRPLIVGIGESPVAFDAARAALDAGRRLGAPVRLVHVIASALPGAPGAENRELHRRAASVRLEQLRRELQAAWPEGAVGAVLRDGPASLVLLDEARSATAVVIGVPAGEPLGPVATVVTTRAGCPVYLHRADHPESGSGVVVGVDGGPGTAALISAAAAEAARRGSRLLVLHTWVRRGHPGDDAAISAAERRLIDGYLASARAAHGAVPVDVRVIHGDPVSCLTEAGGDAELLVVGRRTGVAHRSSSLTELADRCATSVLVVPVRTTPTASTRRDPARTTPAQTTPAA